MKYAILFENFATRQPRVFILFFQNSTLLDNSLYSLSTMAQIASNTANQNAAAQPKQIYSVARRIVVTHEAKKIWCYF